MTGTGKSFAKLDGNIAKGMPVEMCAKEVMRAVFHGQDEMILGGLYYQVMPYILMFIPQWLKRHLMNKQLKTQLQTKDKAN